MAARRRALVVDDSAVFRARACALLAQVGLDVVGQAVDGPTTLSLVDDLEPDLVLLDVMLPGMDGFEVAAAVAHGGHRPAVILTSAYEADAFAVRLGASPVIGFVPKLELSSASLRHILEGLGHDYQGR